MNPQRFDRFVEAMTALVARQVSVAYRPRWVALPDTAALSSAGSSPGSTPRLASKRPSCSSWR